MRTDRKYQSHHSACCGRCGKQFDGQALIADGASPHLKVCPDCYDEPVGEIFAPDPDQIFWPDHTPYRVEEIERSPTEDPVERLYQETADVLKRKKSY